MGKKKKRLEYLLRRRGCGFLERLIGLAQWKRTFVRGGEKKVCEGVCFLKRGVAHFFFRRFLKISRGGRKKNTDQKKRQRELKEKRKRKKETFAPLAM